MLSQRSNGICVVTHKSLLSSSLLCGVVCSSGTRKEEQGYSWDYACRVYVHARVLGTAAGWGLTRMTMMMEISCTLRSIAVIRE